MPLSQTTLRNLAATADPAEELAIRALLAEDAAQGEKTAKDAAPKLPAGWKLAPSAGNYVIFESKDVNVRVQDTKRTGHPLRYQVLYRPAKQTLVQDGKMVERQTAPKGQWLEVDEKSSLAAALALGEQTEKHMQQGKAASAEQSWTVYLFSDTGEILWQQQFQAKSKSEADRQGQELVKPHLKKHQDAEDWVVEKSMGKTAGAYTIEEKLARLRERRGEDENGNLTKLAKSNAKVVDVPASFSPVVLEEAQAKRKEFPFEGFIDFQGIKIDVENAKGSTRSGEGPEGPWTTYMFAHYGEIRGTEGTDGDKLDVYVGDNHDSSLVVVIHQHNPWDGQFDEDKVVIGCESVEESIGLYKKQYDRPGFFKEKEYTAMPIGAFWRWVQDEKNHGKKVKLAGKLAMWKKGYAEGQPGVINAAKSQLSMLLAALRAMAFNYQTSHWQITGDAFYGDHLLFDRLYGTTYGEVDGLAEKMVGLFGKGAVDGTAQSDMLATNLRNMSAVSDPLTRGLQSEQQFQALLTGTRKTLKDLGQLSMGMDDMLPALANAHDAHVYLLQQRLAQRRAATVRVQRDPVKTLAGRYMLRLASNRLRGLERTPPEALSARFIRAALQELADQGRGLVATPRRS